MQQDKNPVAEYIADITIQLSEMAKAARLETLANILKMAHIEARAVVVGSPLESDVAPS